MPPSPACGLSPATPIRGCGCAGGLERVAGEPDRLQHAVLGDQIGHGAQRHVRGDARRGELVRRVDLADIAFEIKHLDEEPELVLELEAALMHGLLVAGREADRVELAGLREAERHAEGIEHRPAGDLADLADRRVRRVDRRPGEQRRPGAVELARGARSPAARPRCRRSPAPAPGSAARRSRRSRPRHRAPRSPAASRRSPGRCRRHRRAAGRRGRS